MAASAFTKNYTDHSNSSGYQFEFQCDKCGSGFRSSYVTSSMGLATGLLGAPSACPNCKGEIPAAAKFCPDRGTPRSA